MADKETKMDPEIDVQSADRVNAPSEFFEAPDDETELPKTAAFKPTRAVVFIAALLIAAAAGAAAMTVRLSDSTSEPKIRYDGSSLSDPASQSSVTSGVVPAMTSITVSSEPAETEAPAFTDTFSYPADINTASFECLTTVNGINRSVAQGIIDYREVHGRIHDLNELLDIYGVGERTLSIIKEHFYISEQDRLPAVTTPPAAVTSAPGTSASSSGRTSASTTSRTGTAEPIPTFTYPADINTASFECLASVSGINRSVAQEIIKYREAHGRIRDLNELLDIYGIGERTLSVIKEHFYISGKDKLPAVTTLPDTSMTSAVTSAPSTTTAASTEAATKTTTTPKTTTSAAVATAPVTTTAAPVMRIVNINTATAEELAEGLLIAPEIAMAIVELREKIGRYVNDLELLYIDGFSESMLVERRPFIRL